LKGDGGTGGTSIGSSDFVSADAASGQDSSTKERTGAVPADDGAGGAGEATVEEGDIYRVLGNNKILNLNSYRGLQIIDFADVHNPRIVGRVPVVGAPVELYVVGDRAFVGR
jgi:hypothetical protein